MQGNLRPVVTRDCLALAKSKGATTALNPSLTYPAQGWWNPVDREKAKRFVERARKAP